MLTRLGKLLLVAFISASLFSFSLSSCAASDVLDKVYLVDTNKDGAEEELSAEEFVAYHDRIQEDLEKANGKAETAEEIAARNAEVAAIIGAVSTARRETQAASGVVETAISWLPPPFNNIGSLIFGAASGALAVVSRRRRDAIEAVVEAIEETQGSNKSVKKAVKNKVNPVIEKYVRKLNKKQVAKKGWLSTILDVVLGIFKV